MKQDKVSQNSTRQNRERLNETRPGMKDKVRQEKAR